MTVQLFPDEWRAHNLSASPDAVCWLAGIVPDWRDVSRLELIDEGVIDVYRRTARPSYALFHTGRDERECRELLEVRHRHRGPAPLEILQAFGDIQRAARRG